jgi:glucosylceramidase
MYRLRKMCFRLPEAYHFAPRLKTGFIEKNPLPTSFGRRILFSRKLDLLRISAFCFILNPGILFGKQGRHFEMENAAVTVIRTNEAKHQHFARETVRKNNVPPETETAVVNLYDDIVYQEILGFGGAFTEASAYNYALLDTEARKELLSAYFDPEEGLGYNFGRTHINSCDFSLSAYTYVQNGDSSLSSFSIEHDRKYLIPFLQDAGKAAGGRLKLFASPWSPPAYMKDNGSMFGGGKLLGQYRDTWAHYYAKYVKAFRAEGIDICAVSVQNEPNAVQTWESCFYGAGDERSFLKENLIPALDAEGLSDLGIIIWDHNRERVYDRAKEILSDPEVGKHVWAVGHHWYSGDHFDAMRLVHDELKKPLICTEICGALGSDPLELAERYGREICENLNHYDIAVCDWNLLLNENGGPFHNRGVSGILHAHSRTLLANLRRKARESRQEKGAVHDAVNSGCSAPVMADTRTRSFRLTPAYFYIGQFSRYVKRGAKRIAVSKYTDSLSVTAAKNPDGSFVCILMNSSGLDLPAVLRFRGGCTMLRMPAHSIATVLF